MSKHEKFMRRCIELAQLGGKSVKTNPQVGSVLVYENQIIGEGFHKGFGEFHGERMAILDARKRHPSLIKDSILYVTLEPCCTHGKTPPCLDLILTEKIKKVVIGTVDPNPSVAGKSIDRMKKEGIDVQSGILQEDCEQLIAPFKAHLYKRPYVILKWAQSQDGFIGKKDQQVWFSNEYSKMLVHKWRSEVDGIMVGTNTVLVDNPSLTTRNWYGENPTRIVIDRRLQIAKTANVLDDSTDTLIMSAETPKTELLKTKFIKTETSELDEYLKILFAEGIYILLVEGGAKLLKSFVKNELWDEARIIKTPKNIEEGIKAPTVEGKLVQQWRFDEDYILKILPR